MSDVIEIELFGGPSDGEVWCFPGPEPPCRFATTGGSSLIEPAVYGEYALRQDLPGSASRNDHGGYRYDWRGTR